MHQAHGSTPGGLWRCALDFQESRWDDFFSVDSLPVHHPQEMFVLSLAPKNPVGAREHGWVPWTHSDPAGKALWAVCQSSAIVAPRPLLP